MVKSAEHWSNFSPSLAMLTYPNNGKIPKWDKKLNKHTNKIVKKNLLHGLYPYNTINVRCKCSTFLGLTHRNAVQLTIDMCLL